MRDLLTSGLNATYLYKTTLIIFPILLFVQAIAILFNSIKNLSKNDRISRFADVCCSYFSATFRFQLHSLAGIAIILLSLVITLGFPIQFLKAIPQEF